MECCNGTPMPYVVTEMEHLYHFQCLSVIVSFIFAIVLFSYNKSAVFCHKCVFWDGPWPSLRLQCHVIRYRSNWSNKGEVSGGTNEPVKCLKSKYLLKSFAVIIRGDNTFICNIKTILTFWVYTKKINFVYIVIR